MMETEVKRPMRREGIRAETIDGETVLYDPLRGHAVYLNETASLIWQLCDGSRTADEMATALQRELPGKPQVGEDMRETIARFAAAGLLV